MIHRFKNVSGTFFLRVYPPPRTFRERFKALCLTQAAELYPTPKFP